MDRPSRKTKTVNYCEAKDFDDDEDFACVKAPPSKKPREGASLKQKKPSSKPSSQETNSQSSQSHKSRKPLDEKLLERDLEAAITLSMLNNPDDNKEQSLTAADVKVQLPVDKNTDPSPLRISNCSVDIEVMGLDRIAPEIHKRPTEDDDDDYQPKMTPESESEEDFSEADESEDEEFTVKKASKAKRKEKVTKSDKPKTTPAAKKEKQPTKPSKPKPQAAAVPTVRSPPPKTKPAPRNLASSSAVSTSKPLVSPTTVRPKLPKWNPPALIGKSPTSVSSQRPVARSPGQGLRLGLSRLARVKPLHPRVASH